ncbi:MAG: 1 4-dihydroxy-2-naphthoate octaprenyltransferase [Chloroflexi bacterium]|nr:MAG: 1 4-dihydroxy-2-naphthoate octaprenyltransferase [Chloroflexota bacterium]MBA4375420.1 prenyltransferase [Anaerolinea sp.]
MKINFGMWRKALSSLVKMDSMEEWNRLDLMSKWFIATRSGVTIVTLYSCAIGGLLAWRDGFFAILPWLIITTGLFIAHGTNNLLNDLTDYSRGIDSDNYFRTQYGVHPLVQGFWTKNQQLSWFVASGFPAVLAGVFALFYTNFSPVIIWLFTFGAVVLLFYTWPLKHIALGELSIFLIWGPILVSGVYLVLAKGMVNSVWDVALAAVPFGLSVVSINIGKHIDKSVEDRKKRVGTLPVLIGEKAARILNMVVIAMIYLTTFYLIFVPQYFTPVMMLVLVAGKRAFYAIGVHAKPRPVEPPKEWPAWPAWFSGFAFYHNRLFSNLFLLGLIIDVVLRLFLPDFWTVR